MKQKILLLSILMFASLKLISAQPQPNYDKMGPGMGNPPMMMESGMGYMGHGKFDIMPILRDPKFKFSEEQLSKIDAIQKKTIIDIDKKQIELQQERVNIKEELFKDSPELSKLKTMLDKKASIAAEIEYLSIKRDLDIKAVMTKEQFTMFQDTMKKFMMEKRERFHDNDRMKKGDNKMNKDSKTKPKK